MSRPSKLAMAADPMHYNLAELLVAYDFSEAADSALKYAVMLAKYFGSSIRLVAVQTPSEFASALEAGRSAMEIYQRDIRFALQDLQQHLRDRGIWCDSVRRIGSVSDTIEGVILENTPDLLLLGAFGYGAMDRRRLGSTAEHLLRTIRCPTFMVGPQAMLQELEAPLLHRILCPMSRLDPEEEIPLYAAHLAIKTGAEVEILHVIDMEEKSNRKAQHLNRGPSWVDRLHELGVSASCSIVCGRPEEQIAAYASSSQSSLVLFGLHRSGSQMVECQDGVVSATIRQAPCPVLVVPPDSSC